MPALVSGSSRLLTSEKLKSSVPAAAKMLKCIEASGVIELGKPAPPAITPARHSLHRTAKKSAMRAPPEKPVAYARRSSMLKRSATSLLIAFQASTEDWPEPLRELFEPTTIQPYFSAASLN